jgi:hypothetical protein
MTPAERAWAEAAIAALASRGTASDQRIAERLTVVLRDDPENFVDQFFAYTEMDNPTQRLAERLLNNGAVDKDTRVSELGGLYAVDHEERKAAQRVRESNSTAEAHEC